MFKGPFCQVWFRFFALISFGFAGASVWPQTSTEWETKLDVPGMPTEVVQIMSRQMESWNRGDLNGFMSGYWESDSLMFIGGTGITYGHAATLARYQSSYPDAMAMGTLSFVNVRWESVGANAGWLVGRWHLAKQERADAEGMYTLLWRKLDGRWLIVADHSS